MDWNGSGSAGDDGFDPAARILQLSIAANQMVAGDAATNGYEVRTLI